MELHTGAATHTVAKRLWGILRVTLFMIRKGVISKRKLIVDMNVMMKRGKLWRKTLSNLVFHHHHHHHHHHHVAARGGYGVQEYEFSCSNSPNPVFFRALKRKHAHNYFPCINPPRVVEEEQGGGGGWPGESSLLVPMTPDRYVFNYCRNAGADIAVQERLSPLAFSPFSVRVSNYSSEEEDESDSGDERNRHVDDEAEEFIRRFYEQLRTQSRTQLLQYQEESA